MAMEIIQISLFLFFVLPNFSMIGGDFRNICLKRLDFVGEICERGIRKKTFYSKTYEIRTNMNFTISDIISKPMDAMDSFRYSLK